jgi:hypothetical protein
MAAEVPRPPDAQDIPVAQGTEAENPLEREARGAAFGPQAAFPGWARVHEARQWVRDFMTQEWNNQHPGALDLERVARLLSGARAHGSPLAGGLERLQDALLARCGTPSNDQPQV